MKLRNETIAWNTNVDWKVNSSQCVHYRDVFLFSFMYKLVTSIVWRFSTINFSANIFPREVEEEKNSINFGRNQLQEKFRKICLPWFVSSIAKLPHPVYTCLYLIVLRFWRAYLGYYKQGKLYKKTHCHAENKCVCSTCKQTIWIFPPNFKRTKIKFGTKCDVIFG